MICQAACMLRLPVGNSSLTHVLELPPVLASHWATKLMGREKPGRGQPYHRKSTLHVDLGTEYESSCILFQINQYISFQIKCTTWRKQPTNHGFIDLVQRSLTSSSEVKCKWILSCRQYY
ncbi:hypothetical protein GDO78_010364 [Eleutherodactylus coqui]|uniref:Uncharacterized protein n=1 Tax=Eleutherodactylus coqui TaxID=57060 RepID=A0A8J6F3Y9_ELECQ|nr:hypothetical protein GDO78_010364 [Eleutherodactylus coqui]